MAGCRSFKTDEIVKILKALKTPRDKALFVLGVKSGFRISELLSLKISNVTQFGSVVDRVRVQAMFMKGGEHTREIPLHKDAKAAIEELINTYPPGYNGYLFKSREGDKAISRGQAHHVLKNAFKELELQGKVATHSMRKTFAQTVYKALKYDIYKTAKALGHKNIGSTGSYLSYDQDEIDAAIVNAK